MMYKGNLYVLGNVYLLCRHLLCQQFGSSYFNSRIAFWPLCWWTFFVPSAYFEFLIKVPSLVSAVDAGVILFLEKCQLQLDVFRNVFHCNMKLFSQKQSIFCRDKMWKW